MSDEDHKNEHGGLISVTVTDLFGIGKAAKSPAAQEIVKSITKIVGSVVDPARTLLVGLARNKVDTNRIVAIARAEAQARQIAVKADDSIERMKQRVITTEVRRQINIETISSDAIEYLDREYPNGESRPIDDEWIEKWMEGAKDASAENVRVFWSRLLASQALAGKPAVSGPSVLLLRSLDADLASAFSEFAAFLLVYGCYPYYGSIKPNVVDDRKLAVLEELGFISFKTPDYFGFREFKLSLAKLNLGLKLFHTNANLTQRAYELCNAIFSTEDVPTGELPKLLRDKVPSLTQQIKTIASLVELAVQESPKRPIFLSIPNVDLAIGDAIVGQPSDLAMVFREIADKGGERSELVTGVLRALHERQIEIRVENYRS